MGKVVENVIKCIYVSQTDCNVIKIYKDVQFDKHENAYKPCCIIDGDLSVTSRYEATEKKFEFVRI